MLATVALAIRLRRAGCRLPFIAISEAKSAGLGLVVLCAVLEQESNGGRNEFGHDPTIFVDAGRVTQAKYLAYKRQRGATGKGGMQGVGPMQLTWWESQDKADRLGGCWVPRLNVRVGAEILADAIRRSGLTLGLAQYNGSGVYAEQVLAKMARWRRMDLPPCGLLVLGIE